MEPTSGDERRARALFGARGGGRTQSPTARLLDRRRPNSAPLGAPMRLEHLLELLELHSPPPDPSGSLASWITISLTGRCRSRRHRPGERADAAPSLSSSIAEEVDDPRRIRREPRDGWWASRLRRGVHHQPLVASARSPSPCSSPHVELLAVRDGRRAAACPARAAAARTSSSKVSTDRFLCAWSRPQLAMIHSLFGRCADRPEPDRAISAAPRAAPCAHLKAHLAAPQSRARRSPCAGRPCAPSPPRTSAASSSCGRAFDLVGLRRPDRRPAQLLDVLQPRPLRASARCSSRRAPPPSPQPALSPRATSSTLETSAS